MAYRIITVAVICFLYTTLLLAQENDSLKISITSSPTPANKASNIIVLRGTALPYFIGNDAGIATSVGIEYIFLKHHSIGIDGFLHLAYGSHDTVTDTAGVLHNIGSYHNSTEKAIFLNYRYYFNPGKLKELKGVTIYISPYFRYGYIERHDDPLFKVEYTFQKERSTSEGILLGLAGRVGQCKRCKFDVNAGPFQKRKDITTTYLEDNIEKTRSERKNVLGLRIGMFFTYLIY